MGQGSREDRRRLPRLTPAPAGLPSRDTRSEDEIRGYIKIAEKESTDDAGRRKNGETVVNRTDSNAQAAKPEAWAITNGYGEHWATYTSAGGR